MSNVNQPVNPAAPGPGTQTVSPGSDAAVDAYRRAVEAKPTNFTENPIGAMASAMDKLGRAAGGLLHKASDLEGRGGLADGEQRLMRANDAARANPNSLAARQEQLKSALLLLKDMQGLAANDPRRVKVAAFVVSLANQLGPQGIPRNVPRLDVLGMLRLAAQVTSRFGNAAGMQAAFALEGMVRQLVSGSSVEAVRLRDALLQKFAISRQASALLSGNWGVQLAGAGVMPSLDMSSRTLVLSAQQQNANLGVLARAYWHDASLTHPADRDGFIQAFLKIANSGGFTVLNRKYRELRRMARDELASRSIGTVGHTSDAAVVGVGTRNEDESGDMFAAVAAFSHSGESGELPGDLSAPLQRFFT